MNARRGFFRQLAGASAAAGATTALAKPEVIEVPRQKIPDSFVHGEWRIQWSGYHGTASQDVIAGNWTAKPATFEADKVLTWAAWRFHGVVAMTTGSIGPYHMADCFNTCQFEDAPWILTDSSQDLKDRQREVTLHKLTEYLRDNPLAKSENCFRCGPIEKRAENQKKYGYGY